MPLWIVTNQLHHEWGGNAVDVRLVVWNLTLKLPLLAPGSDLILLGVLLSEIWLKCSFSSPKFSSISQSYCHLEYFGYSFLTSWILKQRSDKLAAQQWGTHFLVKACTCTKIAVLMRISQIMVSKAVFSGRAELLSLSSGQFLNKGSEHEWSS